MNHSPHIGTKLLIFAVLLIGSGILTPQARAASVSLLPTSAVGNLATGDLVSFDVFIDFSDVGGTLGGGFDVRWDPAALGFVDLASAGLGDPGFGRDPDIFSGLLESWAVADFNGIVSGLVGSLRFEVLAGMGASTLLALGPTAGIGGPWVSNVDFMVLDPQPDFGAVELGRAPAVIPLPPALWLFVSSLIAVGSFIRRRRPA